MTDRPSLQDLDDRAFPEDALEQLRALRKAAKAMLEAFGGDTPDYLRREAGALEDALYPGLREERRATGAAVWDYEHTFED